MVRAALKRPITVLVLFMGLLLFSVMAIRTIPIDIFPKLNAPTIYVIEQYGGMSASQMEGFFATRMQDQFLYINGIKNVESKNIQGLSLIKLTFYENTNMAEASAQVALQVNRVSAFFPPGALPPQVIRFRCIFTACWRVGIQQQNKNTERNIRPGPDPGAASFRHSSRNVQCTALWLKCQNRCDQYYSGEITNFQSFCG